MAILGAIPAKNVVFFGVKYYFCDIGLLVKFVASLFTEVIFAKYAIVR